MADLLEDASRAARAAKEGHTGSSPGDFTEEERVQAAFLGALVAELQPGLKLALRSKRILLGYEGESRHAIALKSDGTFVHIDDADQQDPLDPLQVVRLCPDLLGILKRVESELREPDNHWTAASADLIGAVTEKVEQVLGSGNGR